MGNTTQTHKIDSYNNMHEDVQKDTQEHIQTIDIISSNDVIDSNTTAPDTVITPDIISTTDRDILGCALLLTRKRFFCTTVL